MSQQKFKFELPPPKYFRFIKKTAAVLFVLETAAFAGSYLFYHKLNTDRDLRHYCHENYPTVLEGYYQLGEYFDSKNTKIRSTDLAVWAGTQKTE